jgi:hypothetical protein
VQFIPLGTTGSTNQGGGASGGGSAAWFIDVANNQVVLCSQTSTPGNAPGAAPTFTCAGQPVPAPSATPRTPGASGAMGASPMQ